MPYDQLEEHDHGMWRKVPAVEQEGYIEAARRLMADPPEFLWAMLRVVEQWPNSMTAAMTTPSLNRRAYMGHAGCCLATGSPEDLTRLGWHRLTEEEQQEANAMADEAIAAWEERRPGHATFWPDA
jgi:hypothetical protein